MKITSEQAMLDFGEKFAKLLLDDQNTTFRDRPRLTRSGMSEAPPITMGWRERVEEGSIWSSGPIIIELIGDVGAGKTTFVRGLAKGLGITEPITSPSFTISKQYALPRGGTLIHYDFYRLKDPGLMADDLTESINSPNTIVVIEWPNSITNFLPQSHIAITINYNEDNTRNISYETISRH